MIKNYITVCMLALFCAFSISQLSAQETKEVKKVVLVEKVKDENGKITEKKIVKEGKEAEEYLKTMEKGTWVTDDGQEIELEGKDYKMIEKKVYKMVTKDDDGNETVIEWDGEGEMPEEIKEAMKEHNVEIDMEHEMDIELEVEIEEGEHEHKKVRIIKGGDGNHFVFEVDEDVEKNSNKAQLGVFIEAADNGARVIELMEGSAAEKAGIVSGDIITRVNDSPVNSIETLISSLSSFEANDIAIIELMRDGEKKSYEVVLQERKESFEHKNWKEVIELHERHEEGEHDNDEKKIKKKIIIKKDNK